MAKTFVAFIFFFLFILIPTAVAQEKIIRINDNGNDPNAAYAIKMIKLALAHIDEPYALQISREDYTQARIKEEVKTNGALDLSWGSSNREVESELLPVRIPLFKGLLGYRILIIHKKNQHKFDQVHTLDDLKKMKFGQGRTWADTRILEANGFQIIKVTKYPNIFYMTDGERFDAFPRGVHEPFRELEMRPQLPDLTIEKNLMIAYRMPYYLFVAKNNTRLADDLKKGLLRAIKNGSFDETFYNDPSIKDVLQKANMKNRKVFYIDNPLLSPETPLDAELWFDPKTLP